MDVYSHITTNMSSIRLTLNDALEEIIQEIEAAYKPMSRTEILKLALAEFYRAHFSSLQDQQQTKKNIQAVDKWLAKGAVPNLPKGQFEDAFGDWWSSNKDSLRN